jgi:Uma2 family endonuclease
MTALARKLMTPDEFLLWCLDQEERYELVDGVPVEMMTGASNRHDTILGNVFAILHAQLRGTGCRPATADIAVKTRQRGVRRPDITVTCDPPRADTYDAEKARMVVDVLSPSNRGLRWQRKLEEYRERAGLCYILLIETDAPEAILLSRGEDGGAWTSSDIDGLSATIELPRIGCRLPLADVYDGVTFNDDASSPSATGTLGSG